MGNKLSITAMLSKLQNDHILGVVTTWGKTMTLAEFLKREEDIIGLVALAEKTKVAHTSLRKLIEGDNKREITTFAKIGEAYNMPLWKVMEMAGYNLGLSNDDVAIQLASILHQIPDLKPMLDRLVELDPKNMAAVVVHISALLDAQERLAIQNV